MAKDTVTGTIAGTGAAINISLGFVPSYVKVQNISSATLESMEWWDNMPAANAIKTAGTTTVTRAKLTSNGISPYDVLSAPDGFTIGADADVNVATETLVWLAIR